MIPFPASGRADCAAGVTGGKDELVSVRIVRSLEGRARLAVAAGFQLGACPAALPPVQRDLFSALTHRAFVDVLEQSARAGCQGLICGQGLFAESPPSLENVRAAMASLRIARRAGMTVVAIGEPPGLASDGTDFLADVGLVDALLTAQAPDSVVVPVADFQIGLVTGGAIADGDAADLVIEISTGEGQPGGLSLPAGSADLVVDTCADRASLERLGDVPTVATGWAGPSLERRTEPGFVILDIDPSTGATPSFVPTEVLRPARLSFASPRSGSEVANLIAPELGTVGILDVELHGQMSRAAWHEVDPPRLIEEAASAGTLLRFAIDELQVADAQQPASASTRSSFLVNARRVSERLLAAADDDDERALVTAARAHVADIARRRESAKVVS